MVHNRLSDIRERSILIEHKSTTFPLLSACFVVNKLSCDHLITAQPFFIPLLSELHRTLFQGKVLVRNDKTTVLSHLGHRFAKLSLLISLKVTDKAGLEVIEL